MSIIGIDLGTTNSCVAVYRKDQVEIIQNDQGSRVTPSFVSFTDDERLVGDAAKQEAPFNFENTLFQIKRLIGRTYDDPIVQADMKLWGFSVINDDNKPKILVISNSRRKIFCPEEISAMVLESLKKTAEDKLGKPVTDAVITVPAYFNDAQRSATRDAGKIAGLNVVRMINEPTAAAIAYGLDHEVTDKKIVVVFDLGGGTFDVTVANIKEGAIDVQATGGDTHLGGDDFDNRLVQHFVSEFNSKYTCDMTGNKMAMNRLRVACEVAKRQLSVKTIATVQVDGLHNGKHFRSKLSRAKFDELNYEFFSKCMEITKSTLSDAKINKDEVSDVVLVGGSTRIVKIRELLSSFFGNEKINKTINPDEAVANGAAIFATSFSSDRFTKVKKMTLSDVTPLSIGWKKARDQMVTVLQRNTKIPIKKRCMFHTSHDYQTEGIFTIYEGERANAKENNFLGFLIFDDIPSAPKGQEVFDACFSVDANGILTVTNRCRSTGTTKQVKIGNKGRLSPSEIEEMVKKAETFKIEDDAWKERCKKVQELEDFVYAVKRAADDPKFRSLSYGDRGIILEKCDEMTSWIEMKKVPEIYESKEKQKELKENCEAIFKKTPKGIEFLRELKI